MQLKLTIRRQTVR